MKNVLKKFVIGLFLTNLTIIEVFSGNSKEIMANEEESIRIISTDEIIQNVINAKNEGEDVASNAVSTRFFDYYVSSGSVTENDVSLNALSTSTSQRLTESGTRPLKIIPNNQICIGNLGTNLDTSVIFSFNAKQNGTFSITNEAGTTSNTGLEVSILKKTNNSISTLKEPIALEKSVEANSLGGQFTVNKGETLYWVLKNTAAWERYLKKEAFPVFVFNEEKQFDENLSLITELTTADAITQTIANANETTMLAENKCESRLFDYYVSLALVNESKVDLAPLSTKTANRLTDTNRDIKVIPDNQISIGNLGSFIDYSVAISFTFKDSGTLNITNKEGTVSNVGLQYAIYKENVDGSTTITPKTDIQKSVKENDFANSFAVKKGDTIYFVISNSTAWQRYLTKNAYPTFTFKDYTYVPEINEEKEYLENAKKEIIKEEYSENDYLEIINIYDKAINDVTETDDLLARKNIKEKCIADIKDFLKLEEVQPYIEKMSTIIQGYIDELSLELYKQETIDKIYAIKTKFVEQDAIGLTRKSQLNAKKEEAVSQIKGVLPDNIVADETSELTDSTFYDIFVRTYYASSLGRNYFVTPALKGELFSALYNEENIYSKFSNLVNLENVTPFGIYSNKVHSASSNWQYEGNAAVKLSNTGWVQSDKSANTPLLIMLTATENVHLTITSDAWERALSEHALACSVSAYIASMDEETNELYTYQIWTNSTTWPNAVDANWYDINVDLKKGQSFVLSILGANGGNPITLSPKITANQEKYDVNNMFDIDEYIALQKAMDLMPKQLETELNEINASDYFVEDYLTICALYENAIGKDGLFACKTMDELNEYITKLHASVNEIEKISTYKERLIKQVTDLIASLNEKDYSLENWTLINSYKTQAEEALASSSDKQEMEDTVNDALVKINSIEKEPVKENKGCKGNIDQTMFAIASLMLLIVLKKRK